MRPSNQACPCGLPPSLLCSGCSQSSCLPFCPSNTPGQPHCRFFCFFGFFCICCSPYSGHFAFRRLPPCHLVFRSNTSSRVHSLTTQSYTPLAPPRYSLSPYPLPTYFLCNTYCSRKLPRLFICFQTHPALKCKLRESIRDLVCSLLHPQCQESCLALNQCLLVE